MARRRRCAGFAIETIAPEEVFTLPPGRAAARSTRSTVASACARSARRCRSTRSRRRAPRTSRARCSAGSRRTPSTTGGCGRSSRRCSPNAVCARDDVPSTRRRRPDGLGAVPRCLTLRVCFGSSCRFVLALAFAGNATAGAILDRAATALQSNPVYVDPVGREDDHARAGRARAHRDRDEGPRPDLHRGARRTRRSTRRAATRSASPTSCTASSATPASTPSSPAAISARCRATSVEGKAGKLATQAFDAHQNDGIAATLVDFVDRVGDERSGKGGGGSSFAQHRALPDPADRRHPLLRLPQAEACDVPTRIDSAR